MPNRSIEALAGMLKRADKSLGDSRWTARDGCHFSFA
jgi:hypothetical protein